MVVSESAESASVHHFDRSKRRVLTWTVWKCLSLSLARGVACLMTVRACLTKLLAGADIPAISGI